MVVFFEQLEQRIELILCTIPKTGICNFSNIVIPRLATCKEAFCPVETIIVPMTIK